MLEDTVERLKQGKLLESDYPALVEALSRGEVVASGAGSIAAGGSIVNSNLTTFVARFGNDAKGRAFGNDPREAQRGSEPIAAPGSLKSSPIPPAFTGREREEEIVAVLTGQGGLATISALKAVGGVGQTALAVKVGRYLANRFPDAQLLVDLRGTSETPIFPEDWILLRDSEPDTFDFIFSDANALHHVDLRFCHLHFC